MLLSVLALTGQRGAAAVAATGVMPTLACMLRQCRRDDAPQLREMAGLLDSSAPTKPAPSDPPSRPATRPPCVCAAPGCGGICALRLCGGCGTVRYRSEACSRAHWREHRAECRRLQAEQAAAAAAQPPAQP